MAANVFEEKFGPAQPLPPLAGAQDVSAQGAPAASGAAAQAAPAPQGNPDNVFEKMFGPATGATPPPPTEEAPPPKQPNALEQFGHALDADVEAGLARVPAAVQEAYGNSKYNSARARMWQAMILPDALRYAQQHQSSLTDDPLVQSTAKHLGMRVDQFTRDWPDYAGKSDAELQKIQADAKVDMADGANWKQKGEAGRKMAGQIEQGYGTIAGDHPIENEALHLASIAPELSAPLIAGAVAGPPGAIAAGSVVAGDFAARGYSSAKDAGAPEAAAQLYGALSAAAMLVPEIPVIDAVSKDAVPILSKAFAKQAGQTAVNQGAAMGVQQALIIGLNKGVLNQDTSLPDALRQIGVAMVEGHIIGAGMQTAHTAITNARAGGGPQPIPGEDIGAQSAATNPLSGVVSSVKQLVTGKPQETSLMPDMYPEGRHVVEAGPANAMETAQGHAMDAVKAEGGDDLSQVAAATQVNAHIGAVHDAAAVQGARDAEAQHVAGAMELRRQQAAQADADEQALIDQGNREQALNQAQGAAPQAPPIGALFDRRAQEQARQKDQDFTAAKNQVGDEEIARATDLNLAAEKGTAGAPLPTVADTLTPEQRQAFDNLKAQRAAKPTPPSVQESMRAQAKGTPDDFKELPPGAPTTAPVVDRIAAIKAAATKAAAQKRAAATAPVRGRALVEAADDEELPQGGPPAPTKQSLAQVRNNNLDKAMAAKVRAPVSPEAQANNVPRRFSDSRPSRITPDQVEHTVDGAQHTFESPNGTTHAVDTADGNLRITRDDTAKSARGQGEAAGRIESAARDIHGRGGKLTSDVSVSRDHERVWNSLIDKGYPVVKDPAAARNPATGNLVASDPRRAIFETGPRDLTKLTGMQLKRIAHKYPGDTAVHAEMERRLNALSGEPTGGTSESQYVARNRDAGEATARYTNPADAQNHADRFPNDRVAKEAPAQQGAAPRRRDTGTASDLQQRLRMSHDEAQQHVQPFIDRVGTDRLQVHASTDADTVPAELRAQIQAKQKAEGGTVHGVYDKGVAHVFADGHETGDSEAIRNTTVHELTHYGLDAFLGPDYGKTMDGIARDIRNTQWAKDYINRRGLNMRDPKDVRLLADEYVAHMSENMIAGREVHEGLPLKDQVAGHWQKIVDTIRAGLRKLGIVRHWNDNDIAALIRQAQSHVGANEGPTARAGASYKDSGGPRFSMSNADALMEEHYAPDHPMAIAHKYGRTMEEQSKYNPGFVRNAKALLADMGHGNPDAVLGIIGLRNIPDFDGRHLMPNVHSFVDTHDSMEGRQRQLLEPDHDFAKEWSNWKASRPDRGERLDDVIGAATLSGHDPSKPYVERYTADERAADPAKAKSEREERYAYKTLKDAFDSDKIGEQGRSIFQRLRDNYEGKREKLMQAIEDRINATGADDASKKQSIAELRKMFESGRVKGPYFPLQRFGDLWANAKDTEGNTVAFSRFESRNNRDEWLQSMRDQGLTVDRGENVDSKDEMNRIAPDFMKRVMAHAEAADPTGGLAKDLWAEYLKSMPETSMRKHLIPRLGRLGYSNDHLRAFQANASNSAHQQARLEYGHRLDEHIAAIKQEAAALGTKAAQNPTDKQAQIDDKWGHAIAREMGQRYDWLRNPTSGAWASKATKFGFGWYLGYAPATAFRIWTQNPMLAVPILAKEFGHIGAYREMSRATKQWVRGLGQNGFRDQLRGDELKAHLEAKDRGVFSETFTQNMITGGRGGPVEPSTAFKYAGWLFNAIEHHNRVTTHMASYRLARSQMNADGTPKYTHDEASKLARAKTWDAHFDYTNANRPRYLQNDFMKVAGLFKQYLLGVSYRLAREGADMVSKEKTPEQRAAAAKTLGSLIGHMALFAGITGVPVAYWITEKIVNGFLGIPGVKGNRDHPYDMTAALHKTLETRMGTTAADAIMTGPVGAITGASLSNGASYSDLWYKEPIRNENAHDTWLDAMGQALGPLPAIANNAFQGVDQMSQGNVERGIEHFLPPEAAALAKAVRYATQGATDTHGQNILAPGEKITGGDVARQALGFTPQKVADAQNRISAMKNANQAIVNRHRDLQDKYEELLLAGDQKGVERLQPQIVAFNKANPNYPVGKGIGQGVIGLAKRNFAAQASQGAHLQPELQNQLTTEY